MKKLKIIIILFIAISVVVGLFVASWYWIINNPSLSDWSSRGNFGAMFGAVSALFSGLAFYGLIINIYFQNDQIKMQRDQVNESRVEIIRQRKDIEQQRKLIYQQSFESSFFHLLNFYHEILASLVIVDDNQSIAGRSCFKVIYDKFLSSYNDSDVTGFTNEDTQRYIDHIYTSIYDQYQTDITHYFNTVYRIVYFVAHSEIDNKDFYLDMIRSQLSSYELIVIFYFCLTHFAPSNFKTTLETHQMLKYLPTNKLRDKNHIVYYPFTNFRM
jgi:hypothetical protein